MATALLRRRLAAASVQRDAATALGDRIAPAKLRALRRFDAGDESSVELARLAARGARELVASRPETLGAEWMLAHALAWRRLAGLTARDRPTRGLRLDALPPPTLIQQPGRTGLHEPAREIADKIAPLRWHVADDEPARINILIPTIDLRHFFGGYIAKFNLAAKLVAAGERVRIVTVDPVGPLPSRLARDDRVLQRAARPVRPDRGRLRP